MSGTPRLRSAFPATPQGRNSPHGNGSPGGSKTPNSPKLPDISSLAPPKAEPGSPLISFDIIDAPSQRLYAVGIFVLLWTWRFYDWSNLMADETESLWMFMKWVVLDLGFLYFLESAHIPWLEFGVPTQTVFFTLHAILNGLLMFRIPISFLTWLGALSNYLWDSELAISGNSVKYSSVINNPSLILGRQIIHVLPEGSAVLNPDNIPICLANSKNPPPAFLPLRINQTSPILIELMRWDLESSQNETITISSSQAKRLRRDAMKHHHFTESDPVTLMMPVKKEGLYRLHRMIDETHMDVQLRHSSEALIVQCPTTSISSSNADRCRGDLSDLTLEVTGTPPLRVKYRKTVNQKRTELSYQSIQPEDFASPLVRQSGSGPLVTKDSMDLSWARSHNVKVPLNETLDNYGKWIYAIDEVKDAFDNVVLYSSEDGVDRSALGSSSSLQVLGVQDRPKAALQGYDLQRPMLIAKGRGKKLPIVLSSSKKTPIPEAEHEITYRFTPLHDMPQNGEHGPNAVTLKFSTRSSGASPEVQETGLYTLLSVSTNLCSGEVLEPASFMLLNPPEPDLSIVTEQISDQCEGKAVGSRVHLDLTGTPPFRVQYTVKQKGHGNVQIQYKDVHTLRGQIEFRPEAAGEYVYTFTEINDSVYKSVSLKQKNLQITQEVKPAPFARFVDQIQKPQMCIDQTASFDVRFQGEGPWTLEYELLHSGRRTKHVENGITQDQYTIITPPLKNGGEYSIVLTGVKDKSECRKALQQDAKVQVRHQRPKAAFGEIEGKRIVRALEDKYVELPLRLTGDGPWTVEYRFSDGPDTSVQKKKVKSPNDLISTKTPGKYELLSVQDSVCPGIIDEQAKSFEIAWIDRPSAKVLPNNLLHLDGDHFVRNDICEGEEDAMDVFLTGRPPYDVTYIQSATYDSGQKVVKPEKKMHVPLSSAQIKMDASRAGVYDYIVSQVGDSNYDHSAKKHNPLKVKQRVNTRPTGTFANPGKVYSVCQSQTADQPESDVDAIPFRFTSGQPPFHLEVELTRPGRATRAEVISFPNIDSRDYSIQLPTFRLKPGNSVLTVRRIRDSKGCERLIEPATSPRVQVSVHDLPNIQPVEDRTHYCVGERIGFSLSGVPPYSIFYSFEGKQRKATETSPTFRRLAELPGNFSINGVQDSTSSCRRSSTLTKIIHPMPSVKVSKGRESRVDIHAGGEADILFEFGGTPPFEFTYTRSENTDKGKRKHGALLETKTMMSDDTSLSIKASDEGTYEVVAIRDRYCSFVKPGAEGVVSGGGRKLLKNG